jgi:hypothetical protein
MLGRLTKKLLGGQAAGNDATPVSYLARFDREFAPRLGQRADSLRLIFSLLEPHCQALDRAALIVETGSVRELDNWEGDGQSTLLWGDFAAHYDAEVHTVDLDPAAARLIREKTRLEELVQVHTGDSVRFLHGLSTRPPLRHIDLLYLDSFDFDPNNPWPSALHHLKELAAARPCLGPGSIVAVDDNFMTSDGGFVGKGMFVAEWFAQVGIAPLFTGYQFIWRF